MKLTGILIKAGEKILCPKCLMEIYVVTQDLKYGDKIASAYFESIQNRASPPPNSLAISKCCKVSWMLEGSLFTNRGWIPYIPSLYRVSPPKIEPK